LVDVFEEVPTPPPVVVDVLLLHEFVSVALFTQVRSRGCGRARRQREGPF